MISTHLMLFACLFMFSISGAQEQMPKSVKHYGDSSMNHQSLGMLERADGGLYLAGRYRIPIDSVAPYYTPYNFELIGVDPQGKQAWVTYFETEAIESLLDMRINTGGDVVLVVHDTSTTTRILVVDAAGNISQNIPLDFFSILRDRVEGEWFNMYTAKIMSDSTIAFFGFPVIEGMDNTIPTFIMTDMTGNIKWHRPYLIRRNFSSPDLDPVVIFNPPFTIIPLNNDNIYVSGKDANPLFRDLMILQLSPGGDSLELTRYDWPIDPLFSSLTLNGDWLAVGTQAAGPYSEDEIVVIKQSENEADNWYLPKQIFVDGEPEGNVTQNRWLPTSLQPTFDGGFLIGGNGYIRGGNRSFVFKTSSTAGGTIWKIADLSSRASGSVYAVQTLDTNYTLMVSERKLALGIGDFTAWLSLLAVYKYQTKAQLLNVSSDTQSHNPFILFSPVIEGQPFMQLHGSLTSASVNVYDIQGKKVRTYLPDTSGEIRWINLDTENKPLSSGVFYIRIKEQKQTYSTRLVVLPL